jgi:hypothetical protein
MVKNKETEDTKKEKDRRGKKGNKERRRQGKVKTKINRERR